MATTQTKIAIVVGRFNEPVTSRLLAGTLEHLAEKGVSSDSIITQCVPGAVEIPLIAKKFAKTGACSAVICLGAVIRGETAHFDYVCQQVAWGCQQVALEFEVPVIFGVLTTDNAAQAYDRLGGSHGHKGHDAANAALEMIDIMAK